MVCVETLDFGFDTRALGLAAREFVLERREARGSSSHLADQQPALRGDQAASAFAGGEKLRSASAGFVRRARAACAAMLAFFGLQVLQQALALG